MARVFKILCECENHHQSTFELLGVSRPMAEDYCSLVDGTSPMYVYPPGPESGIDRCAQTSMIGKCQFCGAPFKATIESESIIDGLVSEATIRV